MSPDDLRDLGALRHDLDTAVPQRLEEKVVWAFRVHQALTALGNDDWTAVPPSLEARLLGAFREHHARANGRSSSLGRFAWHMGRAAVLLAAAVATVWFALPRSTGRSSGSPPPGPVAAVTHPSPAGHDTASHRREMGSMSVGTAASSRAAARGASTPLPAGPLASASVALSAPRVERPDEFDDNAFMPFSYAAGASPSDETHVVSVDLPRSALLDFGAQADAVPDDTTAVRAEVLMSEDGMPRGIRFVDRAPAALPRPPGRAPLRSPRRLQP